jgi:hypothetical protein
MTPEQREELLAALRHGREHDSELESLIVEDLEVLEPIIDRWLKQAVFWSIATRKPKVRND